MYREEDFLQLSGLQHFAFCRRQWALIHVENQWRENLRTVEGELFHRNAHDEGKRERRGSVLVLRGLPVSSSSLGVAGKCDVVEFRQVEGGVQLHGEEGSWAPYPVEYKRGAPKSGGEDALQLCAQAMCLEEMLCCYIPEGALYYGETRRRTVVYFTPELRNRVKELLEEMHQIYRRGYTPKVKPTKGCNACSLKELCLPKLMNKGRVEDYLRQALEEDI